MLTLTGAEATMTDQLSERDADFSAYMHARQPGLLRTA